MERGVKCFTPEKTTKVRLWLQSCRAKTALATVPAQFRPGSLKRYSVAEVASRSVPLPLAVSDSVAMLLVEWGGSRRRKPFYG
jgi:hypothetical protein